jgi:hypothetical protein
MARSLAVTATGRARFAAAMEFSIVGHVVCAIVDIPKEVLPAAIRFGSHVRWAFRLSCASPEKDGDARQPEDELHSLNQQLSGLSRPVLPPPS